MTTRLVASSTYRLAWPLRPCCRCLSPVIPGQSARAVHTGRASGPVAVAHAGCVLDLPHPAGLEPALRKDPA
jgi:hypothetical protein